MKKGGKKVDRTRQEVKLVARDRRQVDAKNDSMGETNTLSTMLILFGASTIRTDAASRVVLIVVVVFHNTQLACGVR
jgi:hypothetical protein